MKNAHGEKDPSPAITRQPGTVVPFAVFADYRNRRLQATRTVPDGQVGTDAVAAPPDEINHPASDTTPGATLRQEPTTERIPW